jgi:hypothetical protein
MYTMDEPHLFWRYFAKVCETNDAIFQLMISQMPPGASRRLRQVNRAMRAAVNRTVTTVTCSLTGPRFEGELATSFPQADRLDVIFDGSEDVTHVDVSLFLDYIPATSPALVSRLVALDMDLGSAASDQDIAAAVASFLSRCGPEQRLLLSFVVHGP